MKIVTPVSGEDGNTATTDLEYDASTSELRTGEIWVAADGKALPFSNADPLDPNTIASILPQKLLTATRAADNSVWCVN